VSEAASHRLITLTDGRRIEVLDSGPAGGPTLVFHYGTPNGLVPFPPVVDAAAARGLRLVACGRPGYGRSTPHPGRRVADVAPDVAQVLDALGVDEFLTCGWSGGGPHALACAALLPDRCRRAATIASVAPFDAEGLDWLAGMGPENVEEFGAALKGETALVEFLEVIAPELALVDAEGIVQNLGGLLPDVDRSALQGSFGEFMAESLRASVTNGIDGWRDDDLAFVGDWGFDLARIRHVSLWQGSADLMVPFDHGRWLASAIPAATAHLLDGEGHLSLAVSRIGEIVDDLLGVSG
jgi:pimeloyl-ACP methyl ester carboxylesterase